METERLPRLTVYTRDGCHLCHDMTETLHGRQAGHALEFDAFCIDRDGAPGRRYGHEVPLLMYGEREICRHRLDTAAVTAFLSEFR